MSARCEIAELGRRTLLKATAIGALGVSLTPLLTVPAQAAQARIVIRDGWVLREDDR